MPTKEDWVGEVAAILNEFWVLIRAYVPLRTEEELVVCGVVPIPDTATKKLGIEHVVFPKGRLVVSLEQASNLYLAATGRYKPFQKTVLSDPFSLSGFGAAAFGRFEKTVSGVEAEGDQALVDKSQALDVQTAHIIGVGDKVRRG